MSTDLEWLLIRKYNSFTLKRVVDGPIFSKEPGNLTNIHSHKCSGIANSKTIDIREGKTGAIQITTKKLEASPHAVSSNRARTTIRSRSGTRKALGVTAGVFKSYYRPDLRHAALARVAALSASKKEKKPAPSKKARGKKAKAAAAAS